MHVSECIASLTHVACMRLLVYTINIQITVPEKSSWHLNIYCVKCCPLQVVLKICVALPKWNESAYTILKFRFQLFTWSGNTPLTGS